MLSKHSQARIESQHERLCRNIDQAIRTMEEAVESCKRRHESQTDAEYLAHVLHELAWGFANASSGLIGATQALNETILTYQFEDTP